MKTTLHFALFFILAFGLNAQDVSMTPESFNFEIEGDEDLKIGYVLTNERDVDLTWFWDVTLGDEFPEGWDVQVCDQALCWAPNTLRRPVGSADDNLLAPGQATNTIQQYIQVNSNGISGSGTLEFCIYDNSEFTESVLCSSFFTSTNFENEIEAVNIYPNPASDYFQLSEVSGVAKIDLYNIVGSKVASYEYDDNKSYDISDLRNGLYVARLLSTEGRLLKSVRLSKKQ